MPADFDKCVLDGGRVRTIPVTGHPDQYMRICIDKSGKNHAGEVKTKKKGSEKPNHFTGSITDLTSIIFSEDTNLSEIEVLRIGNWNHPLYGELAITQERLERFKANFDAGLRKGVPIDLEHYTDGGAVGWVTSLRIEDGVLFATVEWTKEGIEAIRNKKYRFFSPEFADEYTDYSTDAEYKDVLIGGALTNRPFFQELEEIVLSENIIKMKVDNMEKEKCKECGKMIAKKDMVSHMKKMHPDKMEMKGGEKFKTMALTKEELKTKLTDNPDYEPTEEDGVSDELLTEVKDEITADAGGGDDEGGDKDKDKGGDDADKGGEGDGGSQASDKDKHKKFTQKGKAVTIDEDQLKRLEFAANEGVKAMRELRTMKITTAIASYTYSADNKDGVILPKSKEIGEKLMLSFNENQRKLFEEFLKTLPKVNMFSEVGDEHKETEEDPSDDPNTRLHKRAQKLMSEQPDKFKTYNDAAYEAEKQLKAEGVDFVNA